MASHKSRLISLLVIEAALVALHIALRIPAEASASPPFEWHFWAALIGGVALVGYALSIRCPVPSCRKHQVFRGLSFFDLRWPSERCYACGSTLEQKPSAHKP
jgi:hypothetical protein